MLSDDPGASKKIEDFARRDDRWMVAVRMVSEGVDIPRLAVGVYATTISTPLFFAQAVGPLRAGPAARRDRLGLPAVVPALLAWPARWRSSATTPSTGRSDEDGLDADETLLEEANREQDRPRRPGESSPSRRCEARRTFDRVLYDGGEFGTRRTPGTAEEEDFLGLPGLLEPDQVATLLRKRQAEQLAATAQGRRRAEADAAELAAARGDRRSCARSSTAWSARGTTAPASRTG